ncbi:MAG TPA: SLOG family protein [Bacteroidales bacterium]|jgi:hypothetical protein|nr:SLOG family protein [Bacteroidales bacterium]
MRLVIAGSRDINWYHLIRDTFTNLPDYGKFKEIVSGGARGVDKLGELIAQEFELKLTVMNAKWDQYGKSAGYKRNKEMAKYTDEALIIWDGVSKGTKHMIDLMDEENKICHSFMLTTRPIYVDRRQT